MKTVNLLPEWYLQQQRHGRRLRLQMLLLLLLGGALFTWTLAGRHQTDRLTAQRDGLLAQRQAMRDLAPDLDRNAAEIRRLANLQAACHELGSTVPMSAVLQQILNSMTPGMALSHTSIDVRSDPLRAEARSGDGRRPAKFHDVAHINITGIAPDAMLIAQFIGRLSDNPLFTDVALNYSRPEILREYNVRRFDILMNLDLDRIMPEDPHFSQQAGAGAGEHDAL